MHLLLIAYFLSSCQAYLEDEISYLDSTLHQSAEHIPASNPLRFATKLDLRQELELGRDMYWSDTLSSTKRSGFDLTKHFPIPPKIHSWTTGSEYATIFNTLSLSVQLEIAPMHYTLGSFACTTSRRCEIFQGRFFSEGWRISSPITKDGREWEEILTRVIPQAYLMEKKVPSFSVERRTGMWAKHFNTLYIVISGTLYQNNPIDDSSPVPFVARLPLSKGNELIGIIRTMDYCKSKTLYEEAQLQIKISETYNTICHKNDNSIFYHNYY
ncbi:hypothetical protein DSO57_1023567 [Entomophthora muscae]|uniref:Uncharacterized protein n=1 Tax=Entomophthora muscae TaxID=34485 RepID=A0ACC2SG33_9FUNG|nr:hypothetical protein DSO57_1023567 [Entomophthora muscae]